ncbi:MULTISPECIES: hypothetical protein [Sphingomonas]|jgi:hypothetical protein|uniref:Uncharacterized protein n=1 Tax=Sphingomonas zeae TaxID=1646122 RepID=A0A7Y6B2V8_9SPHN|nr:MULTISPECIES: hypothetical protein [Sphingomonas]MBB4049592.1 hypothetical protein [Sphingomonas zeae]MCM3679449.1 hypothetical protein [Sphingomonas paucimobilis]MDK8188034.1 hypothetical protein [Sphingomonas zeae]MDK8217898.1 hypothetical protein [Sphingomonas sp. UMB7805-LC452B]NUU45975.1 hypothetical protein [Sphingomonas zeae]
MSCIAGIPQHRNDDRRQMTLAALRARYQALSVSKQVDMLHLMARG